MTPTAAERAIRQVRCRLLSGLLILVVNRQRLVLTPRVEPT